MRPDFDKALRVAKLSGRHHRLHHPRRLTGVLFDQILTRLTAGACLRDVAREPGMPCYSSLMSWQARNADFAKMVAWAREEGHWARGAEKVARADALLGHPRPPDRHGRAYPGHP